MPPTPPQASDQIRVLTRGFSFLAATMPKTKPFRPKSTNTVRVPTLQRDGSGRMSAKPKTLKPQARANLQDMMNLQLEEHMAGMASSLTLPHYDDISLCRPVQGAAPNT